MLLGFKKQFARPIKAGTKIHTIRQPRKIMPKVGETLYMYTGLRNPLCKLISKKHKLTHKQQIKIGIRLVGGGFGYGININVDGRELNLFEMAALAFNDGFKDLDAFCDYWLTDKAGKKTESFNDTLDLYHWTDLKY